MKRADKKEMAEREHQICLMISIGFKRSEIAKELAPMFKVSERSIERQYDQIITNWIEVDKNKLDQAKAGYIMQLSHLYKKAYDAGQWKVASEIVEKQAKMMGLYTPKAQTEEERPSINIVPRGLTVVPKAENGD